MDPIIKLVLLFAFMAVFYYVLFKYIKRGFHIGELLGN